MKPRFYSKEAIGLLSLLFSPFLGCILFSYNLREIGKRKLSPYFIIGGLIWLPILRLLTDGINLLVQLAIVNILGSLLLTFYFWDKYLANYHFEKRSFWKPTLIFLGIGGGLILLQILSTRK
jgi:Na+/glutamate symporter